MSTSATRLQVLGLFAALALAPGCAHTAQFVVTRPAMLNIAPYGNAVTVGPIASRLDDGAAEDVAQELRQRIAQSLNPSLHLTQDGSAVTVEGAILVDYYNVETETVSNTCSRNVDDGPDANGIPQSHTEFYDCSYDVTTGTAQSTVQLRVVTADHQTLFARTYNGTKSIDNPRPDDGQKALHELRVEAVDAFAPVLVPRQETVTERFKDCDGDDVCKQGYKHVVAGDLAGAESLFTQVIARYGDNVPAGHEKQVGEALYDRGVVRAYLSRYPEAITDFTKAIALQPKREHWPKELASIRSLQQDYQALKAQGAIK